MKKIICILLSALMLFSFTACSGINKNIKQLNLDGEMLDEDEFYDFFEEFEETYADWLEDNEGIAKEQSYKISMEMYTAVESDESNIEMGVSVSGKIIKSEFEFKNRFKLDYSINMKGTYENEDGDDVEVKANLTETITYVEGVTYFKLKGSITNDENTTKINVKTVYGDALEEIVDEKIGNMDMGDISILPQYNDNEFAQSLYFELENAVDSILYMYEDEDSSEFYVFENGFACQTEKESDFGDAFGQASIKYDPETMTVKTYEQFVQYEMDLDDYSTVSIMKLKTTTCWFASISKPSNVAEYYSYFK